MNKKSIKYMKLVKLFDDVRWKQFKLLIVCMISIGLNLYFIYLVQDFVDLIVGLQGKQAIISNFFCILLVGAMAFFVGIYQTREWHLFRHTLMNKMRIMMYEKLLCKHASFFDEKTTGDIVTAIMNDGCLIAESAGISILMLILNIFQVSAILVILTSKNIVLGCIEILVGGLYFLFVNIINKKTRNNYKEFAQENADMNQHLTEDIKAILEIKTLNEKDFFSNKFCIHVWERFYQKTKKVVRIDVLSYAVNSLVSIIFPVLMILLGGYFLYQGDLSVGTLLLFYTYTQKLIEPLNNLADFYRGTKIAVGSAERIHEYLFVDDEIVYIEESKSEDITLTIDINWFAWKKDDVLHDIHVTYHGGDKIFVKGESGSGKTTLLKLICGFYQVTNGIIKVNDRDVYKIKEEELFDIVKIQFQEPVILEGTIRENISLGNRYHDDMLLEVLKLVQLSDFVIKNGLDYILLEGGKNLSGGQRQRLALARLFIRRPKILILDEATSGLDAENEKIIIENINKFVEMNKIILLVTSHKEGLKEICNQELDLMRVVHK